MPDSDRFSLAGSLADAELMGRLAEAGHPNPALLVDIHRPVSRRLADRWLGAAPLSLSTDHPDLELARRLARDAIRRDRDDEAKPCLPISCPAEPVCTCGEDRHG